MTYKYAYIAAIQDIESLPARSCDIDTSQIWRSFSGAGSLDKPLMHGNTSSRLRAAWVSAKFGEVVCHGEGHWWMLVVWETYVHEDFQMAMNCQQESNSLLR